MIEEEQNVCEWCGTTEDVWFEPCPYASEIHDDHTCVWLCGKCRAERIQDI